LKNMLRKRILKKTEEEENNASSWYTWWGFFYSRKINKLISPIQSKKNNICNNHCGNLFSLWSSGIRSDHAIYTNDHAANGIKNWTSW
jgi:5-methylcytosine-specific restriction endonuclease McrA